MTSPKSISPKSFLLCRPRYFQIEYEINPWMHTDNRVDVKAAAAQHENLITTLKAAGAQLYFVDPADGLPDMVYTANAGLVKGDKVVLSNFYYPQRRREKQLFEAWFSGRGFTTLSLPESTFFEGAGDALLAGNTLFSGYGFRSSENLEEISDWLGLDAIIPCRLVNPSFYHLDTCFCPLTNDSALIYPPAFAPESLKKMESSIELIPVDEEDARHFACNAVVIGSSVILPDGADKTMNKLSGRGFRPLPVALDEFIKGGGAAKCLTLRLDV